MPSPQQQNVVNVPEKQSQICRDRRKNINRILQLDNRGNYKAYNKIHFFHCKPITALQYYVLVAYDYKKEENSISVPGK